MELEQPEQQARNTGLVTSLRKQPTRKDGSDRMNYQLLCLQKRLGLSHKQIIYLYKELDDLKLSMNMLTYLIESLCSLAHNNNIGWEASESDFDLNHAIEQAFYIVGPNAAQK